MHPRWRSLLALVTSLLLLLTAAGTAAAGPPGDQGKPDRGRDAYVALGDSFSSGLGTFTPDLDLACYRSSDAYPAIIDVERFDTSLAFEACGFGVTTETITPQLQALSRQTDAVTLTVGGNDAGFVPVLTACVGGDLATCGAAAAQAGAFVDTVLPARLDGTYDAVADRVRKAEVVVVGYPRFFDPATVDPTGATCFASLGIEPQEAVLLNALADRLDGVIADRAAAAGFTYVSVVEAFVGHDVCAEDPWVNGLVLGESGVSPNSYHPTAAGHRDGYAPLVLAEMEQLRPSVSQRPGR